MMKSTLELHVSVLVELQIPEISFVKPINAMLCNVVNYVWVWGWGV